MAFLQGVIAADREVNRPTVTAYLKQRIESYIGIEISMGGGGYRQRLLSATSFSDCSALLDNDNAGYSACQNVSKPEPKSFIRWSEAVYGAYEW
ncbi:MAG: hypothetical protein WBA76_10445 [Phormidesmis sp.]